MRISGVSSQLNSIGRADILTDESDTDLMSNYIIEMDDSNEDFN